MENLVGTSNLEASHRRTIPGAEAHRAVGNLNLSLAVGEAVRLHKRGLRLEALDAIGLLHCQSGQTLTYLPLLRWVDTILLTDVGRASHTTIRDKLQGTNLTLHETGICDSSRVTVAIRSNHHIVERHLVLLVAPILAPLLNHTGHHHIVVVVVAQIRATLIPQETLSRKVTDRSNHCAIKLRRLDVVDSLLLLILLGSNHLLQRLQRHPRLNACTAPVGCDNSDWEVNSILQCSGKEVRCSRHIGHALG